jgi:hypothetical protein
MTDETAREGNRELARFLNCSLRTACRLVKRMKDLGVVFEAYRGRPPRRVNIWFPSRVQAYMGAIQRAKNSEGKKEAPE